MSGGLELEMEAGLQGPAGYTWTTPIWKGHQRSAPRFQMDEAIGLADLEAVKIHGEMLEIGRLTRINKVGFPFRLQATDKPPHAEI